MGILMERVWLHFIAFFVATPAMYEYNQRIAKRKECSFFPPSS